MMSKSVLVWVWSTLLIVMMIVILAKNNNKMSELQSGTTVKKARDAPQPDIKQVTYLLIEVTWVITVEA